MPPQHIGVELIGVHDTLQIVSRLRWINGKVALSTTDFGPRPQK